MVITKIVLLIFGLIEISANFFFMSNRLEHHPDKAQKFHGDFPKFASPRAWKRKIWGSFLLGLLSISASFLLYIGYRELGLFFAYFFAGGMLILTLIQAAVYGKEHLPARISVVFALVLLLLIVFHL